MLKDVFGFAVCQKKSTYGFGYKLSLTRNKDDGVIDKASGIADATIRIDHIHWYVPHYTPSFQQHSILSNPILEKIPTELRYNEQSVFMKEVNNQNLWNFELGSQESMNVPIRVIVRFQQRYRPDTQTLNNDAFCRLPLVSAQCIIGAEDYPDASILFNYDDDHHTQGYFQIEEAFRALSKDNILQPYISDDDFRTTTVRGDDVGDNLNVFDIRYQKNSTNTQSIELEVKFDRVGPIDINGYALVLTNKLVSISSDGQRHFDLI